MPSATDKYRKVGDMWERGMALLAWKLDSRGTVVVDVVDHRGIGIGRRDYRTIREGGRNNKYKAIIANNCNTRQMKSYRCSNALRCTLLGAGIHPGMNRQFRVITGQGVRRGERSSRGCRGHPTHVWVVYPG